MGMPITVEIIDDHVVPGIFEKIFSFFTSVDDTFSTYKEGSEISRINRGSILEEEYSQEMREIFALAEQTKKDTNGYFDIMTPEGAYDPSGIVKGWAIERAAKILKQSGYKNFYVDAGGDIQTSGVSKSGQPWRVGIRNPFNVHEVVKVLSVSGEGVATSGTYLRGEHIYDPRTKQPGGQDIASVTVIAGDVYEADRYATAAFAMGKEGIMFIEKLKGCEGYLVDNNGFATMTSGLYQFVHQEYDHA
jgi:thiamine biosynthesis lipoprotein